jgi:tetratricopeptide (TPR) repeat protein
MLMLGVLTVADACKAARRLLIDGDHVGAADALSRFWDGIYSRPNLIRVAKRDQAALLIACGKVTTAKARALQVEGLYAEAIKLIGNAIHILEDIDESLADAQDALANCYLRKGENAKARTVLLVARSESGSLDFNEWATLTVSLARVYVQDESPEGACELLGELAPAVDLITDPLTRANYHQIYANVLHQLGRFDDALIQYAGAHHYFDAAEYERLAAAVKNNIADLKIRVGRLEEAHEDIEDALTFYSSISDRSALGQTLETLAGCHLAENDLDAALKAIDSSLHYLNGGDEKVFLAASWKMRGDILQRMRRLEEAEESYEKASMLLKKASIKISRLRLVTTISSEGADRDKRDSESEVGVLRVAMPDESLSGLNIHAGDQVIVSVGTPYDECSPIVLEFRGRFYVGIYFERNGSVILEADNDEYEDLEFKKGEVTIKGVVIGYIRAADAEADDLRVRRFDG